MKKSTWIIIGLLIAILVVGVAFILTQQQSIIHTAEVTLTINPSVDFTLAVTPEHIESFPDRIATFTASVTSINNFAGEVVFSVGGLPPETTVSILPSNTLTLGIGETKGVQVDIGIPLDQTLVGDYTITVTAESTQYN